MTTTPSSTEYQALPGFVEGHGKWRRLFLGSDHLLLTEQAWCVETYKRFYYRDIQAFVIRRTARRQTINIVCLSLVGLLGIIGASIPMFSGGLVFLICAAAFGIGSLISSLKGPTCETHLQTAIQIVELPSLCRLRKAEKALALLRERILQAQGELTTETLAAATASEGLETAAPLAAPFAGSSAALPTLKPCDGKAHRLMFCLLILDGAINGLQFTWHNVPLSCVSTVVWVAAFGCLLFALFRQHQTDLRLAVRRLTWAVTAYMAVCVMLAQMIGVMESISANVKGHRLTQWEEMRHLASLNPLETPWLFSFLAFQTLGSLGLGIAGLLFLRSASASAPPPEPEPPLPPVESDVAPPPPPSDAEPPENAPPS